MIYDGKNADEVLEYFKTEYGRENVELRFANKSKTKIVIADWGDNPDDLNPHGAAFYYFERGDEIKDARLIPISAGRG